MVARTSMIRRVGVLVAFAFLLASPAARALPGCRAAFDAAATSEDEGFVFVVLLDELRLHEELDENTRMSLADALRTRLIINVETLLVREGTGPASASGKIEQFRFAVCIGRMPINETEIRGDVPEFSKNGIVLEIWGSFDEDEAIITHAVIPVFADGAGNVLPKGKVFRAVFQRDPQVRWRTFLKNILESSLPLRAYAAAGVAMDGLKKREYDLARKYFCRARAALQEAGSDSTAPLSGENTQLLTYVERMSLVVIELAAQAATDGKYIGILGTDEIPVGTPCTGTGGA